VSIWTPVWRVKINAVEFQNVTLADLTITSGRTDIYSQPVAGYCNITLINLNESAITAAINEGITIEVQNSVGTYVPIFGGSITDIIVEVSSSGTNGIAQTVNLTALGALSRLPKALTEGVLSKDLEGVQIKEILSQILFDNWNAVPAALQWNTYDPTTIWSNAENNGLGEIDNGNYELQARTSNITDIYSLVASLANSGLGYLSEDSAGRINYNESTHRSVYLATYGYLDVTATDALAYGLRTSTRAGDVRNSIAIKWRAGTAQAEDLASIATYGKLAQSIQTTLHNGVDAESQADFYLSLRANPRAMFDSISFALGNPNITDGDRDTLLAVFMGLPLNITGLPNNMNDGEFQGFVEGWTFNASVSNLSLTLNLSPIAFSLQAFTWDDVPISEQWNTLSPTLDWLNATVVA
jgi:hypothetical protein